MHWKADLAYWGVFFLGQLLFLLKRADLARRSPLNGVTGIGNFFALNWVTILFRSVVEFGVVLYPYRHVDINSLIAKLGWLPDSVRIPQSIVVAFFLGLFSDMIMDWVVMQDKIFGIPIPKALKETIPQLPAVKEVIANLAEGKKPQG